MMVVWPASSCSTYRQSNFATLGNLLGQNSHKVEDGGVALGTAAKCPNNRRQDVVPILHLNGEDSQTDAKLHPDRFWAYRVTLQEQQYLVSER